jgi:DNA polymerase
VRVDDDRIRYMFQFGGASRTQRFAGRLVQPQNLTRTPKLFDPEKSSERLDVVTNLIRAGDYDMINLLVDEPMMVFGGVMRGMFRAREGYRIHVCDYSSIESVGLAWVSGCERMLDVFRQGRDAYRDFGTVLYKKPYDAITSAERQVCKPAVLAAGYGMGPGQILPDGTKTGLLAYAANMGVPMTPVESVAAIAAYRDTYEEVPLLWRACDNAVASVLDNGRPVEIGPLVFEWCRPFLLIRLPSGRCIYYYKPQIEEREIRSQRWRWNKDHMRMEEETYKKNVLTYMGRNQRNTQWERIDGRGSSLVENITQALTRDILKIGLMRLDAEGFHIIGHAHDEIIVEGNERTWEHMREIMRQPIDWLPGFPLNASGYSSVYYRK